MSAVKNTQKNGDGKQRTIVNCNFRSAGRLSNENARALTTIHETFVRHLSSALDGYLGTGLEVKLSTLEQLPIKDHIAAIPQLAYIVPFAMSTPPAAMIVECDVNLVFPMVELLLGGPGSPGAGPRELSEIEEEIMHDVILMIVRQAEQTWHLPAMSLTANRRVKAPLLNQYCAANEKVTCVKFEVDLAGTVGCFQLVFPMAFLNILIQQIKKDQPQKRGSIRYFPRPSIRERILDCDMQVSSELTGLKVEVRDLIGLRPGSVLKLRAPVRTPCMLTAGGQGFFEAAPVRIGTQKAAQLGRRIHSANWERV